MTIKLKLNNYGFVLVMLALCPIMDNINGFMLLNGNNANISSLYKSIIMLICVCLLWNHGKLNKKILKEFTGIGILLLFSLLWAFIKDNSSLGYNINILVKLLMPYVVYAYLSKKNNENIKKVLAFFSWFYPLSLIVPSILNVGFFTYGGTLFGNKGFYYAGNEISAVMIIIFAYSLQNCLDEHSSKNIINLLINIFATVFIGTKAVYFAVIIISIITAVFSIKTKNGMVKIILMSILLILFAGIILYLERDLFIELIDAWTWRFNNYIRGKYENEFLSFLLSTRNIKLSKAFSVYYSQGIMGILFGTGSYTFAVKNSLVVEMDFFDLLFWQGLIFGLYLVRKLFGFIKKQWNIFRPCEKGLILTIVFLSFLSGHVLYAPSVTLVLTLFILNAMNNKM